MGGNPETDMACQYLKNFFLSEDESNKLFSEYKFGKLLSSDVKKMLYDNTSKFIGDFSEEVGRSRWKDIGRMYFEEWKIKFILNNLKLSCQKICFLPQMS